jgi:hypothetical protein
MNEHAPSPDKRKPRIKRAEVRGVGQLAAFMDLLAPLAAHRDDPKRRLHYDALCAWLLLYFFTPVVTSLRGLQQVSEFASIQRKLGVGRFSLGSFSEATHVFDPALLVPIIEQVGARLADIEPEARLHALELRPTAVDGTLLAALPRMVWAMWRDDEHRAAKLHLQFDLLHGAPQRATLTAGQTSETRTLEANLAPGRLYVADRGYFDYNLMAATLAAGSSFLTRVHDNIAYETLDERALSEAARAAGVEADLIVRVGSKPQGHKLDRPLRLVRIHVKASPTPRGGRQANRVDSKTKLYRSRARADYTLLLLTDQMDLDADLIGLLYRYRWQIELFFRWFKKVLQADRMLALSENGLTLVMYCALLASMLVTLWTGRKPTKRTFELLCFYFAGWIDADELSAHLDRLARVEKTA